MPEQPDTHDEWLKTCTPKTRDLAKLFPLNAVYLLNGKLHFLIGFSHTRHGDAAMLVLTPMNPGVDFDRAFYHRVYVSPDDHRLLMSRPH